MSKLELAAMVDSPRGNAAKPYFAKSCEDWPFMLHLADCISTMPSSSEKQPYAKEPMIGVFELNLADSICAKVSGTKNHELSEESITMRIRNIPKSATKRDFCDMLAASGFSDDIVALSFPHFMKTKTSKGHAFVDVSISRVSVFVDYFKGLKALPEQLKGFAVSIAKSQTRNHTSRKYYDRTTLESDFQSLMKELELMCLG